MNFQNIKGMRLVIFFLIGGLAAIQPDLSGSWAELITLVLSILGAVKSFFPSQTNDSGMIETGSLGK